ncbi:MAG TPA: OmpA family protein [Mycobacteriales bacterium]|nr:OmpA family protein [Mycobacteriales bacterium]
MKTRIPALLAYLPTVAMLSGCGLFLSQSPPPGDRCAWMSAATADSAGRLVILIDRSNSTWRPAGPNSLAPDYVSTLKASVDAAIGRGDVVSIGAFDGTAATVHWFADKLRTDRGSPNPDNQNDDRASASTCLHDDLSRAGLAAPLAGGSDPYGALTIGSQNMAAGKGAKRIEIATDGLATTGCAGLTHAGIGNDRVIDEIKARCRTRYRKLDLTGVAVTMIGVGHPASGQRQPSTLQLSWLGALWTGLCGQLHATCTVSTDAVSPRDDPTGSAESAAAVPTDPVVAFPRWDTGVRGPDGGVVFPVDSDQLFNRNDAHISTQGVIRLAQVAVQIRKLGAASVTVDGYTQAESTPADNLRLAQDRADAVAAVLLRSGVTRITARGHEGIAPHCPPQYVGRRPNEVGQQCTRRVDIRAIPAGR